MKVFKSCLKFGIVTAVMLKLLLGLALGATVTLKVPGMT